MSSTIYWKRLNLCAEIIRANGEITKLQLARTLSHKGVDTTPWTIEKIKPEIEELFTDIKYNKKLKKFFILTDSSLSTLSSLQKPEELK